MLACLTNQLVQVIPNQMNVKITWIIMIIYSWLYTFIDKALWLVTCRLAKWITTVFMRICSGRFINRWWKLDKSSFIVAAGHLNYNSVYFNYKQIARVMMKYFYDCLHCNVWYPIVLVILKGDLPIQLLPCFSPFF